MMMTAEEIAKNTKFTARTIYRKAREGKIPYYKSGRSIRFKLKEVENAMKGETDERTKKERGAKGNPEPNAD